jgi:serine/threonine-protein kinase RsbW
MSGETYGFKSRLSELDRFRDVIADFVSPSFQEIEKNRIILALDEAFVNIVTHGYADNPDGPIDLTMEKRPDGFQFVLMDRAPLFDPTGISSPNLREHTESGKNHGLGIHLYTTIMKAAHAPRPGGGNILTLFKEAF